MGIEPGSNSPENPTDSTEGGAKSGALASPPLAMDLALAALIDAWPTLPEPIRRAVLALIGSASS